jgi:hypothetical protein
MVAIFLDLFLDEQSQPADAQGANRPLQNSRYSCFY